MEILITLAVKFWQWSILIALIIIGFIINLFDKKKINNRVNFKYTDYPLMKPLRIATKGKGFFRMILMWLLGVRHWEIAKDFHYELNDRELAERIWVRLRPYRRRIGCALTLLVFAVPFVNFHPLVWGFVADALVDQTLTSGVLVMWLTIMFASYLIGIAAGAVQSYLLEKTGQAFVRDIRKERFF